MNTMKRTKFPAVPIDEANDGEFRDFMQSLPKADKAKLYSIQAKVQEGLFNLKRESYLIGEQVFKARWLLPHGMFQPWIETTFGDDLPYGTAYLYMRIYEVFRGNANAVKMIPMQCLANFTQKDFPREVLSILKEHSDKLNHQSLQNINNTYGLVKCGMVDSDQFLKIAEKEIKQSMDIAKGHTKHRVNRNMREPLYCGIEELVKYIKAWRVNADKMAWIYPYDPNSKENRRVNSLLDEAIYELSELKKALNGGHGFFKSTSTLDGDKLK